MGAPALELTVAVNVTLCPEVEGFAEEVAAVVVAAFATTRSKEAFVPTPQLSVVRIVIVCVPAGAALLIDTTPGAEAERKVFRYKRRLLLQYRDFLIDPLFTALREHAAATDAPEE